MNRKFIVSFNTAAVCFIMLLFSGCGKKISNEYKLPDGGLTELVENDSALRVSGFSSNLCVPTEDADLNTDGVNAGAFALFSLNDGKVVSQHNIYEKVYPASTTKILTCLVALEKGNPDDIVTVPESSRITVNGSSMADLEPGDTLTLRELLYGLMVPSGNDAAEAIAAHISGDSESFAMLMNAEAKRLGATHSNFVNPHGLPDENHYTTAYDMYLIFNEAMKNEEFRKITRTSSYTCVLNRSEGSKNAEREVTWQSGNGFYTGKFSFADNMDIVAGKTGHTSAAGFCLVLGEKGNSGKEYVSVIFNSPIYEQLYSSMRNLASKSNE